MILINVAGQNCWLIPYAPGDATALRLSMGIPVDAKRGLTGNGSRRPAALAPRYTFEYRAMMFQAEFATMRTASLSAQDEPILAPLWNHAYRPGIDTPTITAGLVVAYKSDWSAYAINPGSYAGYDYAAPVIMGRFHQPPRLVASKDGVVTADIIIDENAPVSQSFAPAAGILPADTTFTNSAGYTAPVFPFVPDWSKPPTPGTAVTEVDRAANGPGRIPQTTFYPQVPEQTYAAIFSGFGSAEAAQFMAWWIRRCGVADAHWVATSQSMWHLANTASAGATTLTLALDTPAPAIGANLALCGVSSTEFVRVTAVAGAVLTLASPLVNAWSAGSITSPAILARHTNDTLALDYTPAGWVASCQLSWREVAAEYAVPAGETRGTTLGRLPGAAWFFQIDLDYNGAIVSTYLTNWESGATIGGHAWTYNDCTFDKLIQSIDLEDDNCTFTMRWYAGCPWENWLPGVLAARGFLTINRADADPSGALSNFAPIWKGELSTPVPDGPNLNVKVLGANALFARKGPRQVMSTTCGTSLFKPRCGLALSDWTFNALIVSAVGTIVTIGTITRANGQGMPSGFGAADWFALGWMGWTASGRPQRSGVLTCTALASGQIVLTLDRACGLSAGASVTAAPGCDRQGSTCRTNFNNYPNFRGFEYMPAISPSFIIPQTTQTSAKK